MLSVMLLGTCIVRGNTEPAVAKDQSLQMQKEIERSEYFINKQNNSSIYQSPNRKKGLSAAYSANEMSITSQGQQQHWSFNLTVKGVSSNGRSVYKPVDQPLVNMYETRYDSTTTISLRLNTSTTNRVSARTLSFSSPKQMFNN